MRIAIAEDSGLFRSSLALLLHSLGAEVTVSVASGAELLTAIRGSPPEAVILDIRMPPTFSDEGIRTAQVIRGLTRRPASWSCRPTRSQATPANCLKRCASESATC
jgi:CheY-like chemotaxis protein